MTAALKPMGDVFVPAETTLPERRPHDNYPSPEETVVSALSLLWWMDPRLQSLQKKLFVLDPGAGSGVWGREVKRIWPEASVTGVELRDLPRPEGYNVWNSGQDFLQRGILEDALDLVVGNPPYAHAEEFVEAGLRCLLPGSYLVFLMRLAFAAGQKRRDGLYRKHPLRCLAVCSHRPSFSGDGKTNATDFGIFIWQKGYTGVTSLVHLPEFWDERMAWLGGRLSR